MKVVSIVQARMGSSRLPGKMLIPLLDRAAIEWTVTRIGLAEQVDEVVVATSLAAADDALVQWCHENGVSVYRGSEEDVLDRYYQCALIHGATHVVRITGDCPLIDPHLVDATVALCLADDRVDYGTNTEPMTYPEGMSVEVMPFHVLEVAWRESHLPSHREHVTPFIRFHPDRFVHAVLRAEPDLSHIRLTLDYPNDQRGLTALLSVLREQGFDLDFTLDDILNVLEKESTISSLLQGRERDRWRQEVARDEGRILV